MKLLKNVFFVTGIDTNIGKSVVTGYLAKWLKENRGLKVSTFKMVQTGNEKFSEDIEVHRKICGEELSADDIKGESCPYVFKYPASPHLAAKLDKKQIDKQYIFDQLVSYTKKHELVFCEGAGGLFVPLDGLYTTRDFIQEYNLPVILVTSGKLGSINHTLLSLEALILRNIQIKAVIYNYYPVPENNEENIYQDSQDVFKKYLKSKNLKTPVISFKQQNFEAKDLDLLF